MHARNNEVRHVQTTVPAKVHRALRDLALDLDRPVADLVADGILLLLRFHDRGGGLPEPQPPNASNQSLQSPTDTINPINEE